MKRLIFLYMSYGCAPPGSNIPWNPLVESKNALTKTIETEGYLYILRRLLETKVFDEILIFIESNRSPGHFKTSVGINGYVIPEIVRVDDYLKKDDIIWARGGFRSWFNYLVPKKGKHWLVLYAANTGRQRWKFWDVVLNDTMGKTTLEKRGRLFLDFKKPVNPKIFKLMNLERMYDICIGASYIHDKKGQWRVVKALIEYKRLFKKRLRCIMPGAPRHGTYSSHIDDDIFNHNLNVNKPNKHYHRTEVAKIMNQSKIFIHAGSSGENDRGPLEALRCGCPVIIAYPKYHSPIVYSEPSISRVFKDPTNYKQMALEIKVFLENWTQEQSKLVTEYYEKVSGVETVILPEMTALFQLMQENPIPNKEVFKGVYY